MSFNLQNMPVSQDGQELLLFYRSENQGISQGRNVSRKQCQGGNSGHPSAKHELFRPGMAGDDGNSGVSAAIFSHVNLGVFTQISELFPY